MMKNKTPVLYIVVPCYNEEEVLTETAKQLKKKLHTLRENKIVAQESKIAFVNDGSRDATWSMIHTLCQEQPQDFAGVNLSNNRGHQNALLAGLMTVKNQCNVAISMDADLQDDINAIDEMLEKHRDGFDIVYGVRSARTTDTWFKRTSAECFYRVMNFLGVRVVFNHADYRLMSRRALEGLSGYKEVNLFLRGIIPMIGYSSTEVFYERSERFAGESKYPLRKMLSFAAEGVTSLSIKPIRLVVGFGAAVLLIGFSLLVHSLVQFFAGNTVPGWTSVLVSLWAIGGALMISIGVVGEYVGKIYLETKDRPRYIIQEYEDTAVSKESTVTRG